jgi:hypothetical protein
MSRILFAPTLAALTAIAGVIPARADDARTTRIETRPVYGATVTIEEGVRVFRPLPSERQVIVNPGGAAPLSLGYYDTRYVDPHYLPRGWGHYGTPVR